MSHCQSDLEIDVMGVKFVDLPPRIAKSHDYAEGNLKLVIGERSIRFNAENADFSRISEYVTARACTEKTASLGLKMKVEVTYPPGAGKATFVIELYASRMAVDAGLRAEQTEWLDSLAAGISDIIDSTKIRGAVRIAD